MRDDQTTYEGTRVPREAGPGMVTVLEPGQPVRRLAPRNDLRNHSPDGFQWGYGGSGPAQLALALLADATDDQTALRHYQDFKFTVVALLPDRWELKIGTIREWIGNMEGQVRGG